MRVLRRSLAWLRARPTAIARLVLVLALVLATWPAWRVALLGSDATIEELLQVVCTPSA